MKQRLTLFLSGVSHELGSFREAVENEVQKKGCFAENQSSFAPDYRTVEEMLRRKLHDADAVIHLVGFRFGAEPNQRPADKPRRSYTQMEFDIARELHKPVYVFLSKDASVRDERQPDEQTEDAEASALQLAHRDAVQGTNQLYYFFKDSSELRQLAAALPMVAQASESRPDISRIGKYAPAELIGRDDELKLLNDAWLKVRHVESPRPRILTFVALGGEGKTSLVAKWAAELAHQDWPGCDAAFAWSFYSQGTREQVAASSDLFLKEALTFFGDDADKQFAASAAGAYEKGQRLARIVGQRRSLLILDGLEPLQYAPTSPTPGQLKDQGIAALLKGLAASSHGLCVVTTRYSLPDLRAFWQTTAPEVKLLRLSRAAGVHLLQSFGVKGSLLRNLPFDREQVNEFEKLVEDVQGHALTLNLLGTYLRDAHAGDIRKRDLVKLEEADAEEQGGHAFRVMEAYEREFEREGDKGQRALAVLRLLGLFDRPLTSDCLGALLQAPAIPELTEPLVDLAEAQRNLAFKRLEDAKLLTVNRDTSGTLVSLDAHPLLREYFARRLCDQQPAAWRAAHRRLYEHLCASASDKPQPTLEDLQPLYQAVAHGCFAELGCDAFREVFWKRIQHQDSYFSGKRFGAFGMDLSAARAFFGADWTQITSLTLSREDQGNLWSVVGFSLEGLGRFEEALIPMGLSLHVADELGDLVTAARRSGNLSALKLILGNVSDAVASARKSLKLAIGSNDPASQVTKRTVLADALYQAGEIAEATDLFLEAERCQKERGLPEPEFLYSLPAYRFCKLLLGQARSLIEIEQAQEKAQRALDSASENGELRVKGLGHLSLAEASLCAIHLFGQSDDRLEKLEFHVQTAVKYLLSARSDYLIPALLARAWLRFLTGARTGPESAQADLDEAWEIAERGPMRLHMADIHLHRALLFFREAQYPWESPQADLDEAWEIAERGPMRLHMADIHLHRARLFFREAQYPWESPQADLAAAEKLINECGYHRRDEELADAKAAILSR